MMSLFDKIESKNVDFIYILMLRKFDFLDFVNDHIFSLIVEII